MAKKKAAPTQQPQATISKTEAIKQVLATGLESPVEVVKRVKEEFGLEVHRVYVSQLKARKKSRSVSEKRAAKNTAPKPDSLDAAVEFCEGVGGVDAAKTLLEKIERIRKL